MKAIEIICINDGSTDGSLGILRSYEKKDRRIRVIDKENAGQGLARNIGINMAAGEYIGFVDGDDWIEADMYEKMYMVAKNNDSDLQLCTIRRVDPDGYPLGDECSYDYYIGRKFSDDKIVFNRHDIADEIFKVRRYSMNKIYKRSFLKQNKVYFSHDSCYEDHLIHFMAFFKAQRISIIRRPFYNYLIHRKGSSTSKTSRELALFDVNRKIRQHLEGSAVENAFIKRFDRYRIRRHVAHYYMIDGKDKKKYFDLMKKEFQKLDVTDNPYLKKFEKIFYVLIKRMPYPLFSYMNTPGAAYMDFYLKTRKAM